MGINDHSLEHRRAIAGIEAVDLKRIAALREIVTGHVDEYVSAFFEHLSALEEARPLLDNKALAERTRRLQTEQIVERHNGIIDIAPRTGGGTLATIRLPFGDGPANR